MKKYFIIPIILLELFLLAGCGWIKKDSLDNEIKIVIIDGIEISNINMTYEDNITIFTSIVTNTLKESKYIGIIDIIFKDKDNNEIITLKGLVDKTLLSNNSATITASVNVDLSNYKTIEYKI